MLHFNIYHIYTKHVKNKVEFIKSILCLIQKHWHSLEQYQDINRTSFNPSRNSKFFRVEPSCNLSWLQATTSSIKQYELYWISESDIILILQFFVQTKLYIKQVKIELLRLKYKEKGCALRAGSILSPLPKPYSESTLSEGSEEPQ